MNNLPISLLIKSRVAFLLLLIAWLLSSFARGVVIPPGIPPGRVFLSPDKSKSVKLLDGDYAIKDEKTGDAALVEAQFDPVFAIVWSADSRSIFVVAHVARGVLVEILHLFGNQWNRYTIEVPEEQSHESTVLNWRIKPTVITLVCKVTLQKENGRTYACYEGIFDVDPSTGKTSNLRKTFLTVKDCDKLKSKFVPE